MFYLKRQYFISLFAQTLYFFLFLLPIYYENVPEFLFTVEVHCVLKKPPTTSINVTSFVTNLVPIVLKTRNSIKYVFWFRRTLYTCTSIQIADLTTFFSGSLILFCFYYFLFYFSSQSNAIVVRSCLK